ncbi:MAG: DUF1501 domain-containing protein [Planctomycetaceae bacterium]|nr:DUF1501 domain-containing protein [Planctomycetaceae bacterium]
MANSNKLDFSRRNWMQMVGAAAAAGAGWRHGLAATAEHSEADLPAIKSPLRSAILVFHYGGPSQLETFDPKPDAPAEVRGEWGVIDTAARGVRICEQWPLMAGMMDRVGLIRSMHHPMRNHNSAAAEMLTGRTPAGGDLELLADDARSSPTLGSAVSYGLGSRAHTLPYVALPYTMFNVVQLPGQTPGYLGGRFDRFQVDGNPNAPNFQVSALERRRGPSAVDARHDLLEMLGGGEADESARRMRGYQERALELIASESVRTSFDLEQESAETRDRYGRTLVGQSALLARRLVEGGVNVVAVFDGQHNGQDANWDSHTTLFPRHKQLIPPADRALSALIGDLEERGLLDSTLVISMGEFGRTPKINGSAGRDHWPDVQTVLMAGGGVQGGQVYGASDRIAAYPEIDPVSPGDLAATILWRFGINPKSEVYDQTNRPFRLADGEPIARLFG